MPVGRRGGGGGGGGGRGGERAWGGERNCSLVFPLFVGLTLANYCRYRIQPLLAYGDPIIVIKLPEKLIRQTITAQFLKSRLASIQD